MTLDELIKRFRVAAFDKAEPYFFSDEEITDWLNDAEKEAAIRGRLIKDFDTAGVAQIAMTANQSYYPLQSFYEIESIGYEYIPSIGEYPCDKQPLKLVSQEEMSDIDPHWRVNSTYSTSYRNTCKYAVQYDKGVRLVPPPLYDGKLYVEGYRVPIKPMVNGDDSPEINAIHHEYLVLWALHKAFSVPDTETFDPTRADKAEAVFTRYFGMRPDSDLRRITREDVPHHNESWWV